MVTVDKIDFTARIDEVVVPAAKPDEVLVEVVKWAFTANNVTYAIAGSTLGYWDFFPTGCERGVIPVWGIAHVAASTVAGISVGQSLYGYFPMSRRALLHPGRVGSRSFIDVAPHRVALPAAYNEYTFCDRDPFYTYATENRMLLLRPLFLTSWLLDDFLAEHSDFGAACVILSSASSKTAIGLAYMLSQRPTTRRLETVGLTSEANAPFVESLGLYSRIVTYESLTLCSDGGGSGGPLHAAAATGAVYVDMAGSVSVLDAVHRGLGAALKHSCSVGLSHRGAHDGGRPPIGLPGPRPEFFFAPKWVQQRASKAPGGMREVIASIMPSWQGFVADSERWLRISHVHGATSILSAYAAAAAGRSRPSVGTIMSLSPSM